MTRELMEKINDGILSDSELDEAIKFYRNLLDSLLYFGDEFNLFKNEIRRRLYNLETYYNHRKDS